MRAKRKINRFTHMGFLLLYSNDCKCDCVWVYSLSAIHTNWSYCSFMHFQLISFIHRPHTCSSLFGCVLLSHLSHPAPPKSSNFCALNLVQQSPPFTPTKVYYCCECIYIYTALHCWVRDSRSKYGSTAYTHLNEMKENTYINRNVCVYSCRK